MALRLQPTYPCPKRQTCTQREETEDGQNSARASLHTLFLWGKNIFPEAS